MTEKQTWKCKCGKQAEFVAGVDQFDRLEQYHCPHCHSTFVTNGHKFISEGHIGEYWYQTDFGADVVYYIEKDKGE